MAYISKFDGQKIDQAIENSGVYVSKQDVSSEFDASQTNTPINGIALKDALQKAILQKMQSSYPSDTSIEE